MAKKLSFIDKLFIGTLLLVFGGIVLHALISVGLSTLFPDFTLLIKSWKEIFLIFAGLLVIMILIRRRAWRILKDPIVLLIAAFAALHITLIPLSNSGSASVIAGLMIDLRYLFFFVLVFIAMKLYPGLRRPFIVTFVVGALIVLIFALLQVFVLPPDILKYIGYNETTIVPYLTVDLNMDYIRINSTLRGPNPLGAYAVIILSALLAFWLRGNHKEFKNPMGVVAIIGIGSVVALWASYSRSALIAAVVAVVIILALTIGRKITKKVAAIMFAVLIILAGAFVAVRETDFISNVILHENVTEGNEVNSNDGHIASLQDGVDRLVHQPLGSGVGSTGSASLYSLEPVIIENQYLFVAHEAGWLGLGLFLYLFWRVAKALWRQRKDWLAVAVFASGIGLAVIGLLLPVWVDDTVAIVWWGLAAVVIGGANDRAINKAAKRTA